MPSSRVLPVLVLFLVAAGCAHDPGATNDIMNPNEVPGLWAETNHPQAERAKPAPKDEPSAVAAPLRGLVGERVRVRTEGPAGTEDLYDVVRVAGAGVTLLDPRKKEYLVVPISRVQSVTWSADAAGPPGAPASALIVIAPANPS